MDWRYLIPPILLISLVFGLLIASYVLPYVQNPTIKINYSFLNNDYLTLDVKVSTPSALGSHYMFYVIGLRLLNRTIKISNPPSFFNFGGNTEVYTVNVPLPQNIVNKLIGKIVKVDVMFEVDVESSINTFVYKYYNVTTTLK